jgi:hypothetical protein
MKNFIIKISMFALICGIVLFVYRSLFKIPIVFILVAAITLTLYGCAMGFSQFGMRKLMKYEKMYVYTNIPKKEYYKIILCCELSLLPIYFCVILASLIPIFTYEVWFITLFPCLFVSLIPAKEVYEAQYPLTHYKISFWIIQAIIFFVLSSTCQILIHIIPKT